LPSRSLEKAILPFPPGNAANAASGAEIRKSAAMVPAVAISFVVRSPL